MSSPVISIGWVQGPALKIFLLVIGIYIIRDTLNAAFWEALNLHKAIGTKADSSAVIKSWSIYKFGQSLQVSEWFIGRAPGSDSLSLSF